MGFDNIKDQAADQLQNNEQVENVSDQGLDRAADAAGDRVGQDRAEQGQEFLDGKIGE